MLDKADWIQWDFKLKKYIEQDDTENVGNISHEMCNWMTECNEPSWHLCNDEISSIGSHIINMLEIFLETKVYIWDESSAFEENTTECTERVLILISYVHKMMALSSFHRYEREGEHDKVFIFDDVLDTLLQWGISSKRANLICDCVEAHRLRMYLSPDLKQLDAVRLIGLYSSQETLIVDQHSTMGIFETEFLNQVYGGTLCETHVATQNAIHLGRIVNELLTRNHYTYLNCCKMLHWILYSRTYPNHKFDATRMYCANSFFNHRSEALSHFDDVPADSASVKVLAFLFLFGVALDRDIIERSIGTESSRVLLDACLLREHPFDSKLMFAQVQIFPLSSDTFMDPWNVDSNHLFFITDWHLESFRLPRNAIMSVGYDTMELLALSTGVKYIRRRGVNESLLDLCSGCGIQGIYFAKNYHLQGKLTFMDINERSCHFVTANSCINGLYDDKSQLEILVVEANLFHPIKLCGDTSSLKVDIGRFDIIVSNPPFVAIPSSTAVTLRPSLFAIGGGRDGMGLLRNLLKQVLHHLRDSESKLLMVTELPNVEKCCEMLDTMLSSDISRRIRVAYIEKDVEFSDHYAAVRETEAGLNIDSRDWSAGQIKNRALVLLAIERTNIPSQPHVLFSYNELGTDESDDMESDEEDLFLTSKGIKYVWKHLLGSILETHRTSIGSPI